MKSFSYVAAGLTTALTGGSAQAAAIFDLTSSGSLIDGSTTASLDDVGEGIRLNVAGTTTTASYVLNFNNSGNGLGIDSLGPNSADSGDSIENRVNNNSVLVNETMDFTFTDLSGTPIAVILDSVVINALNGTGESAALTIGTDATPITQGSFNQTVTFGNTVPAGTAASFSAGLDSTYRIQSISVSPVPEPAVMTLFGLGGLLLARRR